EEWADLDRRHADTGYLDTLEAQIRENGITMPVLVGSDGRLWDGHHRLRIAVRAGIGYVPVEIVPPAGPAAPAKE
ncbi:ParB N-terminal domain-containing protein, partial [Streptomyces sp. C1-2]|uniref:ParB N-terminal domain-containing protein n=1 Tax=Streptomyces sp. C1-2 TaxID=2720022 RepID=UPI0014324BD9